MTSPQAKGAELTLAWDADRALPHCRYFSTPCLRQSRATIRIIWTRRLPFRWEDGRGGFAMRAPNLHASQGGEAVQLSRLNAGRPRVATASARNRSAAIGLRYR